MDFDAKYTNLIEKIDKIIYSDYNPKILQNYIKEYKIEKELQEKNQKEKEDNMIIKRKQYVDWNEIRKHEKNYIRAKIHKIGQNEIEKINNKDREKDYMSRIEEIGVNNKSKIINENDKNTIQYNPNYLRVKEFSKLVNKININKIQNQKKKGVLLNKSISNQNIHNNIKQIAKRNNYSASPISKGKKQISHIYKKPKLPMINKYNNEINKERKTPMEIKPDYLRQGIIAVKRPQNKNTLLKEISNKNNIDQLQYISNKYEQKAKEQEQLIKLQGEYDNEACEKMSGYLCDSISAKIAILKKINQ